MLLATVKTYKGLTCPSNEDLDNLHIALRAVLPLLLVRGQGKLSMFVLSQTRPKKQFTSLRFCMSATLRYGHESRETRYQDRVSWRGLAEVYPTRQEHREADHLCEVSDQF
jgi:hypothetical protein